MHIRRLVSVFLGSWLMGLFLVNYIAGTNVSTTKYVTENPPKAAQAAMTAAGPTNAAELMQYAASENNRSMVENWEWVQIVLGLALATSLPFALRLKWSYVAAASVMLIIVIGQKALITPHVIGLGRALDFTVPGAAPDEMQRQQSSLNTLQNLHIGLDIAKGLIGITLTGALLTFRLKSVSGARLLKHTNIVDDPNHSHIDR
jgi:hypothetical protein